MKTFLTILFLSVALLTCNETKASPFGKQPDTQQQTEIKKPTVFNKAWFWLLKEQRQLNRQITSKLAQVKENKSPIIIFYGILLSFIYGILHALGPGHGKVVIISYFSSRKSKPWHAIAMGCQIAFTHVLSAIILVFLTDKIARSIVTSLRPSLEFMTIKIISYSLITLIGFFMLWYTYKNQQSCGCSDSHKNEPTTIKENRTRWLLSISIGFVPCTGSLLILLFTLSHNVLFYGILFVLTLALGTALTLSTIGILCIKGFDLLSNSSNLEKKESFSKIIGYVSSLMIITIGSFMLLFNIKDFWK